MNQVHNICSFLVLRAVLPVIVAQEPRTCWPLLTRGSIVLVTSIVSKGVSIGLVNYIVAKRAAKELVETTGEHKSFYEISTCHVLI